MSDEVDNTWIAEVPDALMMVDRSGTVREWSDGAVRMFGYGRDEAIGKPIHRLVVVAGDEARQDRYLAETIERGSGTFEALRRCKDGTLIYVVISGRLSSAAADAHLLFSEKDVTALKVQRDCNLLESRVRELLDSMPDGIVLANPTGHMLFVNTQAEKLFGYEPGALRGREVDELLPQRFRGAHRGHRASYFSSPRTRAMGAGLELYGLRKDGTEFPVEISLSPLATGEIPVVMSAIRDVSERKGFERALQEKNLELQAANRAKDRFLASMSHELRTPLNAVIGFTGTLLMRLPGEINSEQTRQLEIVRNNARHLLALINDLLNLAKIESGKLEATFERTDCSQLVDEIAASLRPQALSKGLEFSVSVPPEPVIFETDRRAFSQILINLAGNAIKFTERGSVRVALGVTASPNPRRLLLTVSDTGPGIADDELPRLFDAFVQGQASRAKGVEGTGLGLHLSRKLAELLGGELSCTSTLGAGSVFTLTLPEREPEP